MRSLPQLFLALALCVPAYAQTLSTSFINGPGPYPQCLPVTSQDGVAVGAGYEVCFQPTSFQSGNGFSLYLPSKPDGGALIFESCSISYGSFVATSGDGTHAGDTVSQTDAVACAVDGGWTGFVTENFVKVKATCRGPRGMTYPCLANSNTGGSGTMMKK